MAPAPQTPGATTRTPPPSTAFLRRPPQHALRQFLGLRDEKTGEKLQTTPAGPRVYPTPQEPSAIPGSRCERRGEALAAPRGLPASPRAQGRPGPAARGKRRLSPGFRASAPAPARPQPGGGASPAPAPRLRYLWAVRAARPGPSAPLPSGPAHGHRGLYLRPAPDAPLRLLGGRGAAERWGRGGGRRDGRAAGAEEKATDTAGLALRRGRGGGGEGGRDGRGNAAVQRAGPRIGLDKGGWSGKGWWVTSECLSRCWLGGCCIPGGEEQPRVAHPR